MVGAPHCAKNVVLSGARCRQLLVWGALPALVGALLLWREVQARALWQTDLPALAAPAATEPRRPLPASTLALAFGFPVADAKASTRSDITLKGSFVSSLGEARALITSNAKDAVYRVGDRLPGGGVVRRIEARAITLWLDGREQTLALAAAAGTVLRPSRVETPRHLSPFPSHLILRNPQ